MLTSASGGEHWSWSTPLSMRATYGEERGKGGERAQAACERGGGGGGGREGGGAGGGGGGVWGVGGGGGGVEYGRLAGGGYCVKDADVSIRRRAVELVNSLVNEGKW